MKLMPPLLLLPALILVMAACGDTQPLPDINDIVEANVQSLEKDIASLKEQVAQVQAVNKELEGEIAALKASTVSTPTQTPIPPEPPVVEAHPEQPAEPPVVEAHPVKPVETTKVKIKPVETTKVKIFPNWIPMTVESDRVIQQTHEGYQTEWLLFSISNPNDEMGFLSFYIVAIDDSGYKMSQNIRGGISGTAYHATIGQHFPAKSETFRLIERNYWDDRKLPSKWEVALDESNAYLHYEMVSIDDGVINGGVPAAYEVIGKSEEDLEVIPIDPYNNEFFDIDGYYVANKAETHLVIMYACDSERPKSENVPQFEKFPQYSKRQYSYMRTIEIAPKTKIVVDDLKQVNQPEQGETRTCHSWQVVLLD